MAKPNVVSKDELLESAMRCIVENGIEKTTLKAVAEGANVTQGTVYYHFRSKEQLFYMIVQKLCNEAWNHLREMEATGENAIRLALQDARSRCSYHSFYHQLFFSLLASSFQNETIREQLGDLLRKENQYLTEMLRANGGETPLEGIPLETWGILCNALIDGLALHALLIKDLPVDQIFDHLQKAVSLLFKQVSANANNDFS